MKTKGFKIFSPGDLDAGIHSEEFTLSGNFYFEDKEDFDEFVKHLKIAFELYDPIFIETFEQIENREKLYTT